MKNRHEEWLVHSALGIPSKGMYSMKRTSTFLSRVNSTKSRTSSSLTPRMDDAVDFDRSKAEGKSFVDALEYTVEPLPPRDDVELELLECVQTDVQHVKTL